MVDPVIDEHFRRSLGADYMNLFDKKQQNEQESVPMPQNLSPNAVPSPREPSPSRETVSPRTPLVQSPAPAPARATNIEMSVDDHFAKALGDTWKKLQEADKSLPSPTGSVNSKSDHDHVDSTST